MRYWILKMFEGLRILEFLEGSKLTISTFPYHLEGWLAPPDLPRHCSQQCSNCSTFQRNPLLKPQCTHPTDPQPPFITSSLSLPFLIQCLPRILSLFTPDFRNPPPGPNSFTLSLPVPSHLNIPMWCQHLSDYPDKLVCDFLEFGWPFSYTHTVFLPHLSVLHESWFFFIQSLCYWQISLHWVLPRHNLQSLLTDLYDTLYSYILQPLHHNTINQYHVTMWPPGGYKQWGAVTETTSWSRPTWPLTTNFINEKSSKQSPHLWFLWHTIQLSNPPSDNDIVARSCFSFDMLSIVNSPKDCSLTQELNYSWSSVFPILDFFFCLDLASWPSISVSNSALLCISFLILFMYCLF